VFRLAQLARGLVATEADRLKLGLFRMATALLMLAVAAVVLLTGAIFLLSGIYQSLLQYTSPWAAGGIITLVSLLIAALLLFAARRRLSIRPRASAATSPPDAETVDELREATERGIKAGEELKQGLRPIDLLLSAFIAGMVVSRSARTPSRRCNTTKDSKS
jgi:type VI protein secretion system component VasK